MINFETLNNFKFIQNYKFEIIILLRKHCNVRMMERIQCLTRPLSFSLVLILTKPLNFI